MLLDSQFMKMHFIFMFSQFMTSERSTQRDIDPASLVTILWLTINQTYKSRENTAITLTIHENAFHFDVQPVHDLGKINTKRSWSSVSRNYPVTYTRPSIKLISHENIQQLLKPLTGDCYRWFTKHLSKIQVDRAQRSHFREFRRATNLTLSCIHSVSIDEQ